jgi:hypothetical protein
MITIQNIGVCCIKLGRNYLKSNRNWKFSAKEEKKPKAASDLVRLNFW